MRSLSECKQFERGKNTSRTEQGITFALSSENDFNCEIVDIDKCVFSDKDEIRRCDWLFLVPVNTKTKKSIAFYIELKSSDVRSACEQLFNAIERTKNEILNFDLEAIVVGTKGFQPEILNNEYFRKIKRIIKRDIRFQKVHRGNNFTHIEII